MLRVAMVSTIRPETNYTTYLIESLQEYHASDLRVLVYADKDEKNLQVPLANVKLVWNRDWRFVFQILSQVVKDRLDLVHLQHEINMYGGARTAVLFPFLIFCLKLLGVRSLVTVHAAVPIRQIDRRMLEVFGWPWPSLMTPLVRVVFPTVYYLLGRFASKIIVHTRTVRDCLVKDYHLPEQKIMVVPHGVPDKVEDGSLDVNSRWDKSALATKKIILYFGYLHRRKGLEYLIRAFAVVSARFPDYTLILSGGALQEGYFRQLQQLVEDLKISRRVVFTGFIRMSELRYLMSRCEFVVLPAIYSIAGSGPLSQVFAHEKPVIVTRTGSNAEEINDQVDGLFVEPGNVPDLTQKIEDLITNLPLRQRLLTGVKKRHEERAWSKIGNLTFAVYKDLIGKNDL